MVATGYIETMPGPGFAASSSARAAEEPGFTDTLQMRLSHLWDVLSGVDSDLTMLRDRMLGTPPANPAGANAAPQPNGKVAEIGASVSSIIERANDIAAHARLLNGRL